MLWLLAMAEPVDDVGAADAGAPTSRAVPAEVSPAKIYTLKLEIDIPVTVVAGTVGLVRALFAEKLARKSCPCDPSGINALDRTAVGNHSRAASIAADITVYGIIATLPLLDALDLGAQRALLDDLVVFAETLAVNTAIQNTFNFAVARPRPRTYAGDPDFLNDAEGYVSFYAGHVATAFAALSAASYTLQRRADVGPWPWVVTTLAGGSVAFDRVASGHHFPSDVVVAAAAGTILGITIPWLHSRPRAPRLAILPATSGSGLTLGGVF
jgi:membrane-associated phospholipid phosphatase